MTNNIMTEIQNASREKAQLLKDMHGIVNAPDYVEEWLSLLNKKAKEEELLTENYFPAHFLQETFVYEHFFKCGIMYFHFNVGELVKIGLPKISYSFPISDFGAPDDGRRFMYSRCENISSSFVAKNAPIVAVPFYLVRDVSYLVVDGNHRLSIAKIKGTPLVNAYIIDPIIASTFIYGEIMKAFYLFTVEMNRVLDFANSEIPISKSLVRAYFGN